MRGFCVARASRHSERIVRARSRAAPPALRDAEQKVHSNQFPKIAALQCGCHTGTRGHSADILSLQHDRSYGGWCSEASASACVVHLPII